MIDRDEIIRDTPDNTEWSTFSDKVEMLDYKELELLADRLGVSVPPDSPWQDYRDAFAYETWRKFTMAYERVAGSY